MITDEMVKIRSKLESFSFKTHLILIVLGEEVRVLFVEFQECGELLAAVGW